MRFYVFFVYFIVFVFGREEKHVEDIQVENRTKGDLFFFFFGQKGAWGLL